MLDYYNLIMEYKKIIYILHNMITEFKQMIKLLENIEIDKEIRKERYISQENRRKLLIV